MKHEFEEINAAVMMSLNTRAATATSKKLTANIAERLQDIEQRKRQRKAKDKASFQRGVELVIADLLLCLNPFAANWTYRSLHRSSFSGEVIGFKSFVLILKLLESANLMNKWSGGNIKNPFHEKDGDSSPYYPGLASRFQPSQKLRELANLYGITEQNVLEHFITELPRHVIQLKSTKRNLDGGRKDAGRAIRFTSSEQTEALRKQVERINTYLISHELSGGLFAGYIRRFSEGDHPEFKWDRGGRLYAVGGESYQLMKKPERLQMRINHCPVAEIDISSSYLTMLHALLDAPLPASNDLYEVDGLPRDIVKAFVTATIGNNKFHTRWPAKLSQELKKQGFDLSRMPMRFVQAKVCEALPVFAAWEQQPISWSRLMFMESEQMLATMDELREEHDVPSYSVHDSIIIPESKVDFAAHILKMKFEGHFGIQYRLKAHLSDEQLLAF